MTGEVSLHEFNQVVHRLMKAEQAIRTQDQAIKTLQAQVQLSAMTGAAGGMGQQGMQGMWGNGGMGMMGAGAGAAGAMLQNQRSADRSRSPHGGGGAFSLTLQQQAMDGGGQSMWGSAAGGAAGGQTMEKFCVQNGLDDKCSEALMHQPFEIQQYVIGRGPADGRNPSAQIMARLASANGAQGGQAGGQFPTGGQYPAGAGAQWGGEDMSQQVEQFLSENGLDEKGAEGLRKQSPEVQFKVISLGPAEGRNPSAMVMGRIVKAQRGEI